LIDFPRTFAIAARLYGFPVIKAGEIHSFTAVGDSPLVQLDVHLSATSSKRTL
jgi:hypothetical protein